MKKLREFAIVTLSVAVLAGLLTGGLLIAQTSLHEVRGALHFVTFDPKVQLAGNLTFETFGGTDVAEITDKGDLHLVENTSLPATGDLSSDAEIALGTCNDSVIFSYNNGGTMTYLTIDLDGSDTSWAQSTDTPAGCSS
jgi:hypothetical protein|tara:strand:+ start:128 stop:544 length:417 start_codon:yes stop_codon:yes gene_type:complete